jgi:hypothetical protein
LQRVGPMGTSNPVSPTRHHAQHQRPSLRFFSRIRNTDV